MEERYEESGVVANQQTAEAEPTAAEEQEVDSGEQSSEDTQEENPVNADGTAQTTQDDGESGESEDSGDGSIDRTAKFKELMNGEYKSEATEVFKELLNKRFKKHDEKISEYEEKLQGLDDVLDAFGVESLDELRDKGRSESAKKKAYDEGAPEEVVLGYEDQLAKLKRENEQLKKSQQKEKADEFLSTFEKGVMELSDQYGLDTMELLMDEELLDAVQNGRSVKQAYYGLYPDKIDAAIQSARSKDKPPRAKENIAGDTKPAKKMPTPTAREMMERIALARRTGKAIDPETGKVIDS
jgi:hypothetical protein